jgi:hypothetical protein
LVVQEFVFIAPELELFTVQELVIFSELELFVVQELELLIIVIACPFVDLEYEKESIKFQELSYKYNSSFVLLRIIDVCAL